MLRGPVTSGASCRCCVEGRLKTLSGPTAGSCNLDLLVHLLGVVIQLILSIQLVNHRCHGYRSLSSILMACSIGR